jgi:hypothetical protein
MFQIERVGERRCIACSHMFHPGRLLCPAIVFTEWHRQCSSRLVQPSVPLQLQPQICRPGKTICLPAARTVRWRVFVCTSIHVLHGTMATVTPNQSFRYVHGDAAAPRPRIPSTMPGCRPWIDDPVKARQPRKALAVPDSPAHNEPVRIVLTRPPLYTILSTG